MFPIIDILVAERAHPEFASSKAHTAEWHAVTEEYPSSGEVSPGHKI